MKFDYSKLPFKPSPAFPDKKSILRPIINIRLLYQGKSVQYKAVIDSGSDYCIFPAAIGKLIGIDIKSGKELQISGIGYGYIYVYFHTVELEIGGVSAPCYLGFSDDIEKLGFALLGQEGFFDRYHKVVFEYNKERVELI